MKHNGEMNKEYLAETRALRLEMVSNLDKSRHTHNNNYFR